MVPTPDNDVTAGQAWLAEQIDYLFTEPDLLDRALAHRSWCAEEGTSDSNERLEFLGDAVLGLVVAEYTYRTYPDLSDGAMSKVRAALKSASTGLGEKAWCNGQGYTLADIAFGCALGWLDFRFPSLDWRTPYPNLARHYEKLSARASFIETAPPRS